MKVNDSVMEFDSLVKQDLDRGKQSVAGYMDGGVLLMVDDSDHRKADRRKADLALQKSEERYRAFVEHSSEAVWCLDIEPPCSINLSVDAQLDHFYEHGYLTECNDVMAQMFGVSQDGSFVDVEMRSVSLTRNGSAIQAVVRDISGRKLTEAALQEANARAIREYDRTYRTYRTYVGQRMIT